MELRVAKRSRCCQGRLPLARVKVASTGLDDGKNCLRETLNPTSDNVYYVRFGQLILAISAHLRTFGGRGMRLEFRPMRHWQWRMANLEGAFDASLWQPCQV